MPDAAVAVWEGRTPAAWQQLWRLPALHILHSTGSTNDVVRTLAEQGAPAGTLVLAEHQSAGRGRHGRTWYDEPGRALLFSVLLRPGRTPDTAPGTVPLRVGLAVARALTRATGADVRIKWPNDVVHADRKLAGVLCEAATDGAGVRLVAGVGVNVHPLAGLPDDVQDTVISLAEIAGAAPARSDVLAALIDELRPLFTRPLRPLTDAEQAEFRRLDALQDRVVQLTGDVRHDGGTARGVAPDGALLLETGGGRIVRITSATVRPHPARTSSAQRS